MVLGSKGGRSTGLQAEEEAGIRNGWGSGRGAAVPSCHILSSGALRSDYPVLGCNSRKVCAAVSAG